MVLDKTTQNWPLKLETPVQFLKGVGPHRAELLRKLSIEKIEDLLFYFPRDHQDRRVISIKDAIPGRKAAIKGEVVFIDFRRVGKQLGQAKALLRDSTGTIEALWFKHLSYSYDVFGGIKNNISENAWINCFGMVEANNGGKTLRAEDYEVITSEPSTQFTGIVPLYPLTEGIPERWFRDLIFRVVTHYYSQISDPLPELLRKEHKLLPLSSAVKNFHFPEDLSARDKSRERLAFDEFFFLELALAINRQTREKTSKGFVSIPQRNLLTPFKNRLGYEFTRAQTKAINEIFRDMASSKPMNRLLQGDVGSGKTVVALSAALLAVENKRQAAFLAPTEILAEQHFINIEKFIGDLPVKSALLTGSTPAGERQKLLQKLADGAIHLLIGTHAILEEDVAFKQLGLVIIDEQHRFGVEQRAKLLKKANQAAAGSKHSYLLEKIHPDVLILTATPIPRTLSMTIYGDLDVSIIDEMPKGRAPIKTVIETEANAKKIVRDIVSQKQQVYLLFPLIEESEMLSKRTGKSFKAAKAEFIRLQNEFPGSRMALLHGQMPSLDKKRTMEAFREGKIDILVSTPVIEVGIDVANATLIAIFNPDRFGLAQLHQLRGRVGRGPIPSTCLLVEDDPEKRTQERIRIFSNIQDGFKLAEEDLRLRGPGELMGEAQHGIPFFRVGDLLRDSFLITQTREAARSLVQGEVSLTMHEFQTLNHFLQRKFENKLTLSTVG